MKDKFMNLVKNKMFFIVISIMFLVVISITIFISMKEDIEPTLYEQYYLDKCDILIERQDMDKYNALYRAIKKIEENYKYSYNEIEDEYNDTMNGYYGFDVLFDSKYNWSIEITENYIMCYLIVNEDYYDLEYSDEDYQEYE